MVQYNAKQAIQAEEDVKIFETIRRKMNFEEINLIMNDMLNISKLNKNVIDVDIKLTQSYMHNDTDQERLSARIRMGINETILYQSYRINRDGGTKELVKSHLNQIVEGECASVRLYPLSIVNEQISGISNTLHAPVKPSVFKVGLVLTWHRRKNEWVGCAYLVEV